MIGLLLSTASLLAFGWWSRLATKQINALTTKVESLERTVDSLVDLTSSVPTKTEPPKRELLLD